MNLPMNPRMMARTAVARRMALAPGSPAPTGSPMPMSGEDATSREQAIKSLLALSRQRLLQNSVARQEAISQNNQPRYGPGFPSP
jgi:hypothetical protein